MPVAPGWGMTIEELGLYLAVFAQGVLIIWQLRSRKDELQNALEIIVFDAVEDLDGRLAQALGAIGENLGLAGSIEPPNPFQQLIAQWIQAKVNESPGNQEILVSRDEKGKFSSLKDEILDSDSN